MIQNQKLRKILLKMAKADDGVFKGLKRKNGLILDPKRLVDKVRRDNTKKLKSLIRTYGFPSISLAGADGSAAAWLVIQHTDFDLKFQKRCLSEMQRLAKRGEVSLRNLAYLTDRVRINSGRPQIYGTQIATGMYCKKKSWAKGDYFIYKNLKFKPGYVVDPRNLDKRRKVIGLESFNKYVKRLKGLIEAKKS